jgi:RNA polymerase sigma-70 factor (ECF subfamily)
MPAGTAERGHLPMKTVLRHLRRVALLQARDGLSDGALLDSFISGREEAAFEVLLRRHAPMVLGVCRRVLGNVHDADDAFQATFLVLVRKAASVRPRDMVGHWLYGVAYRTALKARAMNAKRRAQEQRAAELPRREPAAHDPPDELLARLDAELSRLPEQYRVPVVLCELEGRSRKEVARLLGLPEGTLSWRLAHAKKLLARRLSRFGAALSAGYLAAVLSRDAASASVPSFLMNSTARAAFQVFAREALTAGTVSARVVALTEGVIKAMLLSKLKLVSAVALAVAVSVGAVGLTYRPAVAQPAASKDAFRSARATADELEELRLEVAALRKGLEVTRERVKVLEGEVQALRAPNSVPGVGARDDSQNTFREDLTLKRNYQNRVDQSVAAPANRAHPPDLNQKPGLANEYDRNKLERLENVLVREQGSPLAQAEAALKKLRANPNDKQAADTLERALKQLKERARQDKPSLNVPRNAPDNPARP